MSSTEIAPFYLARVGGVSAAALERLSLPDTVRGLGAAAAADAALQPLQHRIDEVLYRLVPRVGDDQGLRRLVLLVKRHIHNSRTWPDAAADIDRVAAALDEAEERELLGRWYRVASERDAARAGAAEDYDREVADAARALADAMRDPDLQAGIAIASPDTAGDVSRALAAFCGADWRPGSKLARSSVAYLMRAALKTSPFSTLTQLAVAGNAGAGGAAPSVTGTHRRATRQLVRSLPLSWLLLAARDRDLAHALKFEPNAGLLPRPGKPTLGVLTTEYYTSGSFSGRSERIAERKFDPQRMPVLTAFLAARRRVSYAELLSIAAASAIAPDPYQAVLRLLEAQFVRPVAPYSLAESRPLAVLADAIAALGTDRAREVALSMEQVQQVVDQCDPLTAAARVDASRRLRDAAARGFGLFDAPAPPWLDQVGLLYEDVAFAGPGITLPPGVHDDLAAVAHELRPRLIRGHLYDAVHAHFVRRFGPEGETTDVLGFLQSFLDREDLAELITRAAADDQRAFTDDTCGGRTDLPAGRSSVSPAVSVFFQVAAADQDALRRGEYLLVLNETGGGQGGIMTRFAALLSDDAGDLRSELGAWVRPREGDQATLELTVINDCNNLHPVLGATGRVAQWPAECPTTEVDDTVTVVPLHDLRLRADAADETLYFADRSGRPVSLRYLGLVPPMNFRNALGLLLFLIDPWVCDTEAGLRRDRPSAARRPPEGLEFRPRRQAGRVVLRRASWRLPASEVVTRAKGETEFEFFARVERWRSAHGLPQAVFARAERDSAEFDPKYRKPVWVDFSSPHALEGLRQLIAGGATALTLTEMLPTPDQHWVIAGHEHGTGARASEFIALVRWPMPVTAGPARRAAVPPSVLESGRDRWLFYKIYPKAIDQLDDVVSRIVGAAVDAAREAGVVRRWFFVRYIDREGAHIRLRLQVPAEQRDTVNRAMIAAIERGLPVLEARWTSGEYEPEYAKYGGEAGVAIAEGLFEASSELALAAARSDPDHRRSWMPLHLRTFEHLLASLHADDVSRDRFLQHYIWYWTGQDRPPAAAIRVEVEEAAGLAVETLERAGGWPESDAELPGVAQRYVTAIDAAAEALTRRAIGVAATHVCFDYLHMHHNRLGIAPQEEACLAALVRARLTRAGASILPTPYPPARLQTEILLP